MPRVRVQTEDFNVGEELEHLRRDASGAWDTRVGAVASFIGTVRDMNEGSSVSGLTLEHYPGMTESSIEAIIDQAESRWPLYSVRVLHRVGPMLPADQIVFVGVSSAHREAALEACAFIMDYLKTQAPFWKKEATPEGHRWVDARVSDEQALQKWT
ncbi:MAG: molybdopterin synthase catalytic subunit MoaE [Betaproteobacteria bacterium]|nr:molybdopterin synthase catalytic subunit MoaE [Betaproteobacteria bacterium]